MLDLVLQLLARIAPSTLLFYLVPAIVLNKRGVKSIALAIGLVPAWVLTAIVALFIADEPTISGAGEVAVPSAIVSALIVLLVIAAIGKRVHRGTDADDEEEHSSDS